MPKRRRGKRTTRASPKWTPPTPRRRSSKSSRAGKRPAPKPPRRRRRDAKLRAKDAADAAFAERAKKTMRKRERAQREATIRLIMKRKPKLTRAQAVRRWELGLRPLRREAVFRPADVARNKLVEKFRFRVRKDGTIDTSRAYYRKGPKRNKVASPAAVKRSRAAFLREARYRQIAEVLGVPVPEAKRLVREKYGGETRNALVQATYQALAGKGERRSGPVHWSDEDRLEEEDE